ncbi:toxin CSTX-20-like [Parasteatoda tepidariorum]|uniref:toxin CSTX-20-like n=1 Tax=Parasteatoda tepidariorum TaxID=114398 RepID=UPI00077FCF07|nr:toxin CSTX-20-like isoform X1 [Parasteatoda tepidariorum]
MRFLIILAFLCCLAFTLATKSCSKQSDCEEDECCLDNLFFKRPFCTKRFSAGKRCIALSRYDEEKDIYYTTCPCVQGHECKGEETEDDGFTVVKNAKCVEKAF